MKINNLLIAIFLILLTSQFAEASSATQDCKDSWKDTSTKGVYDFYRFLDMSPEGNFGYSEYDEELNRPECLKEWTVLVYMAADNDLSPYAYWDLHEMESKITNELNLGASTDVVDIVVELDTLRKDGIRRLHMFQNHLPYRDSLERDDFDIKGPAFIKSPIVELIPEDNDISASKRFSQFLSWGVEKYPSKNYMVVIWGHGEGFIGKEGTVKSVMRMAAPRSMAPARAVEPLDSIFFEFEDLEFPAFTKLPDAFVFPIRKPFGGVGFDHSDKSYLTIPAISESLKDIQDNSLDGEKIDILAFDACLMQSLEVLSGLNDSADFLVGSNQIQNYLGMPYRSILDQINLGVTPRDLAEKLPELTRKSWEEGGYQAMADSEGFKTFTMSSISSWHLREFILPELEQFSEMLIEYLEENSYRKNELLFLIKNAPRFQGEMIDLGLLYGLVEKLLWQERLSGRETLLSTDLRDLVVKASRGVDESTLAATFGPLYYDTSVNSSSSYLLGFFKGVSLWLPKSRRLFQLRESEMGKSTMHESVESWNRLLNVLYAQSVFNF